MTYKGNRRLLGVFLLIVLAGTVTSSIGLNASMMRGASASIAIDPSAGNTQEAELENELEQENEEEINQIALAGCLAFVALCDNLAVNLAFVDQDNDATQVNANNQEQSGGLNIAATLFGDDATAGETQEAELENELEQENEAEINQIAAAGCLAFVALCDNTAVNLAFVDQDNDATQVNANNQEQTDNINIAAALFGDDATAGDTQEAELENEAEQENEAEINQIALAGCLAIAAICDNTAVNIANVEQDNDATQVNANNQEQADNFNLALTLGGDDATAGETQEAELENEAEQENEAEINQIAAAGCLAFVALCDNTAVNFANVDQDNDATQVNANNQLQDDNANIAAALFGDDATAGDTQEAELENELEQENEAEINQIALAGCLAIAAICDNTAVNIANVEQDNDATQVNANNQEQADNFNLALTLGGDDATAGETQEAELENEAEQENEAEINQIAAAGCLAFVALCDNTAVNFANVDQDNDATQVNANNQLQDDNANIAAALFGDDATAGDTQEAELENELEQENEAEINQAAFAGCLAIAAICDNTAVNIANVEQDNDATQVNANNQEQADNFNLALTLGGDDATAGETQEAELENEAEQENEAEINQIAAAGCLAFVALCDNTAVNFANVDQDNDATQVNANNQEQNGNDNIAAALFGDDATAGDTQEAELENELEQENEAEINQAAFAGCLAIAAICDNTAVNIANVEQDNDATQVNANNQIQNGGSDPCTGTNCPTTDSVIGDPSDPSNTQEAELENELEQENEAEINQASAAVCEGFAVICDNTAVNFANVDQDNDAVQANANNQGQNGGSNGGLTTTSNGDPNGDTQEAELENEAEQENEAEINQASAAVCEGFAVICDNTAVNFANVEQDNDATQANANQQGQNGGSAPGDATTTSTEDPNGGNTQEAELENELEQENEAEINQAAFAGCSGYAVICDNKAANFANVDQDNDAIQANANQQNGGSGSGNSQDAELENEAEQENKAEINQVATATCSGYAVICDNKAANFANVEQDNDAIQANANNQYSGNGGSGSGNSQDAELENEAEQENKAEINQAAFAGCSGYAVICNNKAVNFANVDQDNDAIQANANNQGQNGGSGATETSIEDPNGGNTQEAELENEAEQENEAEINQAASAGCSGYAVICSNTAANVANVDQDNDATQVNANNQEQDEDSEGGDAAEAEAENGAEQGNEAGVNQAANTDDGESGSEDETEAASSDDGESGSEDETEAASSDDDESEDDAEDAEDDAEDAEDEAEDEAEDAEDEAEDAEEEQEESEEE